MYCILLGGYFSERNEKKCNDGCRKKKAAQLLHGIAYCPPRKRRDEMMQSMGMRMMTGITIKRAPANTSAIEVANPDAMMTM